MVADKIEILSTSQAIRYRPHMYVGDVTISTAADLISETFCLAAALRDGVEHVNVSISIADDGLIVVSNDAQSICTDVVAGKSRVDRIMTDIYGCRDMKIDHDTKQFCKLSMAVLNALCASMELSVRTGQMIERYGYIEGVSSYSMKSGVSSASIPHGMNNVLSFKFDMGILPGLVIDPVSITRMCDDARIKMPELNIDLRFICGDRERVFDGRE